MRSPKKNQAMMRRAVAGVVVVGGACAALIWLPLNTGDSLDDPADQPASDVVEARTAIPPYRPARIRASLGGEYDVTMDLAMDSEVATGRQSRNCSLSGSLQLAVSSQDAAGGWVVGRFAKLTATGDKTLLQSAGFIQADPELLRAPFAVRLDATGAVQERRFDPRLPVGARNLLATMVAGMQVVTPDPKPAASWRASEPGASDTQYAVYTDQGGGAIAKAWSRTRPVEDSNAPAEEPGKDDSVRANGRSLLRFGDHGLASMRYDHNLTADLTLHEKVPQRHQVRTVIELTRKGNAPKGLASSVDLADLRTEDQLEKVQRRPEVARKPSGRSIDEIVADSGQAQARRDWKVRREAAADLAATLAARPAEIVKVREALWQGKLDGDALRTHVEGLGYARTAAASEVLEEIAERKDAPYMTRHSVVTLAGTMAQPSPRMVKALQAIANDESDPVFSAAVLALGAQARLRETDQPGLAARLRSHVMAKGKATFVLDRSGLAPGRHGEGPAPSTNPGVWLQAMGSLGGADVWPLVEPYVVDQRDHMRLYAIEALRFIPLPAARMALAKAMQLDPRPENRRRAAEIALYQPQQAMEESVVRALREDPAAAVQIGAAHTLAVWGVTAPGLYAEIAAASQRSMNPKVKKILDGLQPVDMDKAAKEATP